MKLTEEFKSTIDREPDLFKYIAIDNVDGSVWLYEERPIKVYGPIKDYGPSECWFEVEGESEHKHIGHSDINQYAEKLEEIQ